MARDGNSNEVRGTSRPGRWCGRDAKIMSAFSAQARPSNQKQQAGATTGRPLNDNRAPARRVRDVVGAMHASCGRALLMYVAVRARLAPAAAARGRAYDETGHGARG